MATYTCTGCGNSFDPQDGSDLPLCPDCMAAAQQPTLDLPIQAPSEIEAKPAVDCDRFVRGEPVTARPASFLHKVRKRLARMAVLRKRAPHLREKWKALSPEKRQKIRQGLKEKWKNLSLEKKQKIRQHIYNKKMKRPAKRSPAMQKRRAPGKQMSPLKRRRRRK